MTEATMSNPNTDRDERVREIRGRQERCMRPDRDDVPQRNADPLARELSRQLRQAQMDRGYLLSLLDSQAESSDLKSRDDVLAFFGGSITEDGLLHIDMKKYHAAHLCQEHSFQPWRRSEIEEQCVMCIARDATNAATRMRDLCLAKVREAIDDLSRTAIAAEQNAGAIDALIKVREELKSLTLEGEQEK